MNLNKFITVSSAFVTGGLLGTGAGLMSGAKQVVAQVQRGQYSNAVGTTVCAPILSAFCGLCGAVALANVASRQDAK